MKKFSGTSVYLFAEFSASLCLGMVFVSMSLYEATVAGLSPIQLVLVGTTLELSAFLFEVPTGVVADVYSRRLSIIVGYFLMGVGLKPNSGMIRINIRLIKRVPDAPTRIGIAALEPPIKNAKAIPISVANNTYRLARRNNRFADSSPISSVIQA